MQDVTVLITGIGAPGVYGVIKGLKRNGERNIRIIGVDVESRVASRYFVDKFYPVPPRASPDFINRIFEITREEAADIVFPVPTAELEIFAELKGKFETQGKKVVVSDLPWLTIANNKAKLYEHLREAKIECVSNYVLVHGLKEFVDAVRALGYPGVPVSFKKPVSTGAQGFRILDKNVDGLYNLLHRNPDSTVTTLEEVVFTLKSARPFPELIVQEYLPGDEYDVDILAQHGETLVAVPRKNEGMLWGMSLISQTEKNERLIALVKEIISSLRLSYIVSASFKFSQEGAPRIIEINPRVPGSIITAIGSGVNLPYLAIKMALGEEIRLPEIRWGSRMIRYWDEIVAWPDGRYERYPIGGGMI